VGTRWFGGNASNCFKFSQLIGKVSKTSKTTL